MNELKKLSAEQIAAIQERRGGEYGLREASKNGQREFSDWFWQKLFSAAQSDVSLLLSHIDAMETEYQAGMRTVIDDALRQGEATTKFINEQTARIKELETALKFYAEEKHYPLPLDIAWKVEVEKDRGERAREALKANGPG